MKFAENIMTYHIADEETRKTQSFLLRIILLVALFVMPVLIVLRYLVNHEFFATDLILVSMMIIFAASFYLLGKEKYLVAVLIFIISGWAGMTFMAGGSAGIKDVSIFGYVLLIYLATFLAGFRISATLAIMSVISVWVMAIAQNSGKFVPYIDPPLLYARDFTTIFILVITSIILFERGFRVSYNKIRMELKERVTAEFKILVNENRLKEQYDDLLAAKAWAEESDRLKTAFLQNISHEIRTPMNGIVGLAELIKSPELTPTERINYINKMIECSEQLSLLIDDLISLSRLEVGAVEINKTVFRAADLLEDPLKLFDKRANKKGLIMEIQNNLDEKKIYSDRLKLKQIIYSLTDNAIKFTEKGIIKIEAAFDNHNLVLKVADTGIGISKDDLPLIFEHFRQSEIGLVRSFRGAGLGLSICKGNLKYLGGDITIESEPGKGSVFTVYVPVDFA